jgi:hypothetical protein
MASRPATPSVRYRQGFGNMRALWNGGRFPRHRARLAIDRLHFIYGMVHCEGNKPMAFGTAVVKQSRAGLSSRGHKFPRLRLRTLPGPGRQPFDGFAADSFENYDQGFPQFRFGHRRVAQ